jgi:hypothetical protein
MQVEAASDPLIISKQPPYFITNSNLSTMATTA